MAQWSITDFCGKAPCVHLFPFGKVIFAPFNSFTLQWFDPRACFISAHPQNTITASTGPFLAYDVALESAPCHILELVFRKQRHVTRSMFAAELFGVCDTADLLLFVNLANREVEKGPVSTGEARRLRDKGGLWIVP